MIQELFRDYAGIISLLVILIGFLVVHWFAVGRDRRKEFNDASAPIRAWLLSESENPNPLRAGPSSIEFDAFVNYLPGWKRICFRNAYKNLIKVQEEAKMQDAVYGSLVLSGCDRY